MPSPLLARLPFLRRRQQTQAKNGGCPSGGTNNSSQVAASRPHGEISIEGKGKVSIKIKASKMPVGQKVINCVRLGALKWTLELELEEDGGEKWLAVFIRCQPLLITMGWEVEATVDLILLKKGLFGSSSVQKFSDIFPAGGVFPCWVYHKFKKWTAITDPAAAFITNGFFTVEAHITVNRSTNVRVPLVPLFDHAIPGLTDICLSVGGFKFHASKDVLKIHSAYFDALLSGNFADASKEEIQLQDISPTEFKDLLMAIYAPELLGILGTERLEGLLRVADMLGVECVLTRCGALLVQSDCDSIASRLRLASLYRLPEMYAITAKLSSLEIRSLEATTEWGEISNDAKAALLARMFELNQ